MAINGINPNAAIGAYMNTQRITGGEGTVTSAATSNGNLGAIATGLGAASGGNDTGSVSFSDLLANQVEKTVDTVKHGEEMSAKAITGEANLTDVVQAVTDAEITLQTLVAVRDKMISAYQEIMRMQI